MLLQLSQVGGVDDVVKGVNGESADRQVGPRHPRAPTVVGLSLAWP